jgi:hypothetical protein
VVKKCCYFAIKDMPLYEFTLDANNRTYKCERFVSGQDSVRQTITVIGIGKKDDPANYGEKSAPPSVMQLNARLIAHQIVKGATASSSPQVDA